MQDWNENKLRSVVGYNKFHIHNLLPDNAPVSEMHNLIALFNSLRCDGKLERLGCVLVKKQRGRGNRKVNLYRFRWRRTCL